MAYAGCAGYPILGLPPTSTGDAPGAGAVLVATGLITRRAIC